MGAKPPALNSRDEATLAGEAPDAVDAEIAADLLDAARSAKSAGLTADGMTYGAEVEESVTDLRRTSTALATFNPGETLTNRSQALAFWINAYNAMVIHGALAFGVRRKMTEVPRFFQRTAYVIGGRRYNLDDIEHGILRGNRGHPIRIVLPQLSPWDDRRGLVVRPMDARIHFALNCGAASCPPIRHYTAGNIDSELEMASRAFVHGGGVRVDPQRGGVALSRIFLWYARDFGWSKASQLRSVMQYLDDERREEVVASANRGLRYGAYDWSFA